MPRDWWNDIPFINRAGAVGGVMNKKSVSDRYLMHLWRQAVLAHWGYRDPIAGVRDPTGYSLECHHIVKRRGYILRWDYKNGIPLTAETHRFIHNHPAKANRLLYEYVDYEYLAEWEGVRKNDYLLRNSMTDNEFRLKMKGYLKNVIDSYKEAKDEYY